MTNCNIALILVPWLLPFFALLLPVTETWGALGFNQETGTCTFIDSNNGESNRL
jgi:hypothetical protein